MGKASLAMDLRTQCQEEFSMFPPVIRTICVNTSNLKPQSIGLISFKEQTRTQDFFPTCSNEPTPAFNVGAAPSNLFLKGFLDLSP